MSGLDMGARVFAFALVLLFVIGRCPAAEAATLEEAQAYATSVAPEFGLPDVAVIGADDMARNQRGESYVSRRVDTGEVLHYYMRLNVRFLRRATDAEMMNTVRHELCHHRVVALTGKTRHGPNNLFHGPVWLECARDYNVDLANTILDN